MTPLPRRVLCGLIFSISVGWGTMAAHAEQAGEERVPGEQIARCAVTDPPSEMREYIERTTKSRIRLARAQGSVNVPVYFHVLKYGTQGAVAPAVIDAQISVLNQAYAGTPFRFTLAGSETTDSQAWFYMVAGGSSERDAKAFLRRGGPDALNLYTAKLQGQLGPGSFPIGPGPDGVTLLGGFATFPWEYAADPVRDGVVVHYGTLPSGFLAPRFNQGKTAVHEVGHWLGLLHTFTGGCTNPNDLVTDTPQEAQPYSGCGTAPDTCPFDPGADPIRNYMDYSDDPCLTEFTASQATRMDDQHLQYRAPIPPLFVTGISGQGNRSLGASITNTVTVTGGKAPFSYRFLYLYGGVWYEGQAYGPSSTWTWTPTKTGAYSMQVWVKSAGSAAAWDAYSGYSFNVTSAVPPLVINSFGASATSVRAGTPVSVTLTASGSVAPLQWAPFRLLSGASAWIPNPNPPYSSVVYQGNGTTWTWTPTTADVGTWTITAWARGSDSTRWGAWGNAEVGTGTAGQPPNLTITVTPPPPLPVAHVIWMQPGSMAGFGGATSLVIAGSVTNVPAGTRVDVIYDPWKVNAWLSAPSTTTDANGIFYTYVPNADFTDNYSVIAFSSGVQSPGCWSSPNCNRLTWCP